MRDIRKDKKFFYSQASITAFKKCPLKFKLKYMEGLNWKTETGEEEVFFEKGRNFHLLAERYFGGIDFDINRLGEGREDIKEWFERLCHKFPKRGDETYLPEYEIRMDKDKIRLQGKYDLIVKKNDGKIEIWDWKTEIIKLKQEKMEEKFQTMVYLWMVVENSRVISKTKINPEDVKMVYWQPIFQNDFIEIKYDADKHFIYGEKIKNEIIKINNFDFDRDQEEIKNRKSCDYCEFKRLCNNDNSNFSIKKENILLDEFEWDDIEEIDYTF